ncbi:hypothetical protein [Anaeromassilibacillus senegalensis]|uniref:hypothetical protein n=1 Tax=Anaeromassilibacillus senegalensis TaxID=1673717 RepID=UPI000680D096|nr:hypothetical protein [Anaeromassilibacillus senegalensis]
MAELNFDTGVVTFTVNGKCDITFNPTDSAFVERLFNAFDTLDKKQESYKAEIERMVDKREVFEIARRRDKEMREIVDGVFGQPVCAALFDTMNVYAMADGLPVWCNFMLAVMDVVDTTFAREQKATNPRIAKYTKKYHR